MEAEILIEIKEEEKKAEEIIEKAKKEKEHIIQEAIKNSSKLIAEKSEWLRNLKEKEIAEYLKKSVLMKGERLAEGKTNAKQIKAKAEKNMGKAVDFVLKKFEEMS